MEARGRSGHAEIPGRHRRVSDHVVPDYWTKLPALAVGHKLPDIVSLQSLRSPGFADLMVPLDERIKADKFDIDAFDPSIVKGLSRNGKQFALPYDFGPWVIYYNRDMFERQACRCRSPAGLKRISCARR